MAKKLVLALFITITTSNIWSPIPTVQAQGSTLTQIFILLAPEHHNPPGITQLETFIETNGGRVTHTFPYQAVIAKVATNITQQISTLPLAAAVFTEPVELSLMDIYGPDARRYAGVWNSLISPPAASETNVAVQNHPDDQGDAFTPPDLPPGNNLGVASTHSVTPGYYQTSEYMAGSVAVGIVLVESDGSVDPSTENWTEDEKQLVFNEIIAGLDWWAELEPRANLSFVYDDHFSNPLPTGVEPITRPYYDQRYWIADALGTLGYNASSYFTRARNYTNDLRTTYQTDWAFTIFVVDSSADSDNRFSNGYFAYAYLGGPFTVMTYGNNGYGPYNFDAVLAHEVGHIFRALDQYYSARDHCTYRSGYLHVENQNSQYGGCTSNVPSIMRGQTYPYWAKAIDPYAAGQIGWRDSDGDNIFDPLDTDLPLSIDLISTEGNSITINGATQITPYPSPSRPSATINSLIGVQYRLDTGDWQPATATDGTFDGTTENFHFTTASLSPGRHTLEVAALDSAGNVSDVYATETITIFDPIDGGLNTEIYDSVSGNVSAGQVSTINGVAYHMGSGIVTNVEYRLNGGSWQSATARDGAFDSDYEPFSLTVDLDALEAETYQLEARATDGEGNVEVNVASEEIEVTEIHTTFLPLVISGM